MRLRPGAAAPASPVLGNVERRVRSDDVDWNDAALEGVIVTFGE